MIGIHPDVWRLRILLGGLLVLEDVKGPGEQPQIHDAKAQVPDKIRLAPEQVSESGTVQQDEDGLLGWSASILLQRAHDFFNARTAPRRRRRACAWRRREHRASPAGDGGAEVVVQRGEYGPVRLRKLA